MAFVSMNKRYQQLVEMMEKFVENKFRSRSFVSRMGGEFISCGLNNDERFRDLLLALAMFGSGERAEDEDILAGQCEYALKVLTENGKKGPE
jgi:hypothetical protein